MASYAITMQREKRIKKRTELTECNFPIDLDEMTDADAAEE
jgi:hypothetical protein